eukprot:GEMP01022748.1.p1 GENE.GEMP01022748.1~~GEMP01022748.1.p1  ORF type:complete len:287 (+),score=44.24 GEMP01022748.1:129-989(+)
MDPKKCRPPLLSDAAFLAPVVDLRIKNTFIEVVGNNKMPDNSGQNVSTAPPILDSGGFLSSIRHAMTTPVKSPHGVSNLVLSADVPKRGFVFTPLQTPSPAGFRPQFWPQARFPFLQHGRQMDYTPPKLIKAKCAEENEEELSGTSTETNSEMMNGEDIPLPSRGSDTHFSGTCKRCCFFPRGRCMNGYNCTFCHFDHEKRKRKNKKKKSTRMTTDRFKNVNLWPQMAPSPAPPPAPGPSVCDVLPKFAAPLFMAPQSLAVPVGMTESAFLPPPPFSPNKSLIQKQ